MKWKIKADLSPTIYKKRFLWFTRYCGDCGNAYLFCWTNATKNPAKSYWEYWCECNSDCDLTGIKEFAIEKLAKK